MTTTSSDTRTGRRERGSALRWLLLGMGFALTLLVALGAYVFSRIEPSDYVALISAKAKERTGRELRIAGHVGMALSLVPKISAENVSLGNAPWGSRPDMLKVKRIEVQIALLPLLRGALEIRGLTLIEPDLLLETDPKGIGNWTFDTDASRPAAPAPEPQPGSVSIRQVRIVNGTLGYRDGASGRLRHVAIEELKTTRRNDGLMAEARASVNAVPLRIAAQFEDEGATTGRKDASGVRIDVDAEGIKLAAKGAMPLRTASGSGTSADFSLEVNNWSTLAKLAQIDPIDLPGLKADGNVRWTGDVVSVEPLKLSMGKSDASGRVRIRLAERPPGVDAKFASRFVDLSELKREAHNSPPSDGRIFSADPFALDALRAFNGKADIRVARLALRDGKSLDDLQLPATLSNGRLTVDPIVIHVDGKALRMRVKADASSGKTLALDVAADGKGIALGALGALLDISGTPEGSPTDLRVHISGRGNSVRTLMAEASGELLMVVGPGRIRNRAVDFGADVTELLEALNPGRATEPYTELKCAVVRLPIRRGIVRVDNSIGAETSKVNVIAAGVIDLRNETLDLGFRPKAATGLGVGLANLASLGRLRGTLAEPKVELDFGGAASAATQLGLAATTGGLSLLAGVLLSESVPDRPCEAVLAGPQRARATRKDEPGSVIEDLFGNIKKLFGR